MDAGGERRDGFTVGERYEQFDVEVGRLFGLARAQGNTIPCKRGCDACCYDVALITHLELPPLIEALRAMSPEARKGVRDKISKWMDRAEAAGIDPFSPQEDIRPYLRARLACPLLDLEKHECQVYAARPVACRGHHVINATAAACANRAKVPSIPYLDMQQVVVPFIRVLAYDHAGPGACFSLSIGLLPTLLIAAWPLVENPDLSIEEWLSKVSEHGLEIDPQSAEIAPTAE